MSLPSREFLQEIGPETKLILWISDNSLNLKTPGIKECDYLCDGLINDYLKNSGKTEITQNIFHSLNFGEKLFIAFYKFSKSTLADIDDVMGIISHHEEKKSKIILIQSLEKEKEREKELLAELIRRYRQFNIVAYSF